MGLFKSICKSVTKIATAPFKCAAAIATAPFKMAASIFGGGRCCRPMMGGCCGGPSIFRPGCFRPHPMAFHHPHPRHHHCWCC